MKYKRFFLQINRWEWATFKLGYVRHEGIVTENIKKQNYFVGNQIIYYHYDTLYTFPIRIALFCTSYASLKI